MSTNSSTSQWNPVNLNILESVRQPPVLILNRFSVSCYVNMHEMGYISLPFDVTVTPDNRLFVHHLLTCEVCIIDYVDYYKLKMRLWADGLHIIIGLDYNISYVSVIDSSPLLLCSLLLLLLTLTTPNGIHLYCVDILNTFHMNIIFDTTKRYYFHLPIM